MWLTGFDAPSLSTMYVDKPMRGHGLMQAIARVNRVFRDKPGGLVVDYLGLADQLKHALAIYTQSGGKGDTKYRYGEGDRGNVGEVRDRLRHHARLRLVELVRRHACRETGTPAARAGAHSSTGKRQRALRSDRHGALASVRAMRRQRRSARDSRRHRLFPGGQSRPVEAARRTEVLRESRPRRPAARRQSHRARGRDYRRFQRGRAEAAGYQYSVGQLPR